MAAPPASEAAGSAGPCRLAAVPATPTPPGLRGRTSRRCRVGRRVVRRTLSPVLGLSRDTYDRMLAHAVAGIPEEACGLFAAASATDDVVAFYPMTNAAASESIYEFDGAEHLAVEKRAEEAGLTVIGVMHSHTRSTAYPSPTDVAQAARFDPLGVWHHVIVSLKHPEPALRSYRIVGGFIDEEEVRVRA